MQSRFLLILAILQITLWNKCCLTRLTLFQNTELVVLLIEKNPDDLGELAVYYKTYRQKFYHQVLSYVTQYMQNGTFRQVEFPQYVTSLIIETLSWWGMHIANDAFEVQKGNPCCNRQEYLHGQLTSRISAMNFLRSECSVKKHNFIK